MATIMDIIRDMNGPCPVCGRVHETAVRDVRVGSGLVREVGAILKENGFPRDLLLVCDDNTIRAAAGIEESLSGFNVEIFSFGQIRVARMTDVEAVEARIKGREIGVLSVGSGSVNDPCRLACARQDKKLCIFGTAPSMDGFASYSSPIVDNAGFKSSYAAKSPEVIIGDTAILAAAPTELKAAGFGDMVAKYVGLIDWKVSNLLIGETYCERVAALTRAAIDKLMTMADRVTVKDEETAGQIFEALLMTGIGMSYMQNSRPASGSEHVIAHLIECVELPKGILPNFHGEDVGVCTLAMLRFYNQLAEEKTIHAHREEVDWEDVYRFYGPVMEPSVRKMNEPTTVTDDVDPALLEAKWPEIRAIIHSVPSADECEAAMRAAGCKITLADIGKSEDLFRDCVKYSPYMRRRLTILRLRDMID